MRIGVEKSEPEDLLQQDPGPGDRYLRRVEAQSADPLKIIDANSLDILHGDDSRRGELIDRVRNVSRRVVLEMFLAPLHRPQLHGKVELSFEASLELASQRQWPVRSQERESAFGKL